MANFPNFEIPPTTDPIVNVGIKQSQKENISDLISKSDKYKSINEFVQEAVSKLINSHYQEGLSQENNTQKNIMESIKKVNADLLKNELLGNHKLTLEIVRFILDVQEALIDYQIKYLEHKNEKDSIILLLTARRAKNVLDQYIGSLEDRNKTLNLGIPDYKIYELKNLKNQFVDCITAQEVKG